MKPNAFFSSLMICAVVALGGAALAQPTLNYEGELTGENGPIDATYSFTFSLFDSLEPDDAVPAWVETHENVDAQRGSALSRSVTVIERGCSNRCTPVLERTGRGWCGADTAIEGRVLR